MDKTPIPFSNVKPDSSFIAYGAERTGMSEAQLAELLAGYTDMLVLYRAAIREVRTRLEILDDEFQFRHKRNPIHNIQTRLKTPQSMIEKLSRRGLSPDLATLRNELTDIAGVRVICSYVDDIYNIADMLCGQDEISLLRSHDYIQRPKTNGYRSLHIVVKVPVYLSDQKAIVPVEIQIRTIAMDFWASLEHELRYKSTSKISKSVANELKECAESIASVDAKMQDIYHQLEQLEDKKNGKAKKKAKI